ncbi:MAG: calcineurin-like phosphoesterase family protein [Balneolales bacterium]|nr:calcineurin-like phosphoesterase family protein [Balneolales bacterium]
MHASQYNSNKLRIWVEEAGYRVLILTILLLAGWLSSVYGLSRYSSDVTKNSTGITAEQSSAAQTENVTVSGVVFDDRNQNGVRDAGEPGVAGVLVSNGLSFVRTGSDGSYTIELIPNHDLTIVQPSGWRVPTDERMVPQFFYIHKPEGTGYEMRFGGLPPTGPAPATINFPLTRSGAAGDDFTCIAMGDPQTYSNEQLGFLRDGVFNDLKQRGLTTSDCLIYVGDVVGDDLGLLDRLLELGAGIGAPQWLVLGNHDVDFDARSNDDKADSWRRIFGPNYYAFEQGNVLFVVLDNVFYPCTREDFERGRMNCDPSRNPSYNGRLTETQLQWLEALINETPEDRLIVLSHHIPFVSFVDATSNQHQTDELPRIYAMLEGREVLSLSGHTHTIENHAPGQVFEGWNEAVGVSSLPFRHIVVGAASGAWYQGDFNVDGVPMALQRMGAPMGYLNLEFTGTRYTERYVGSRLGEHRGQWVSLNTPEFRSWFDEIMGWWRTPAAQRGDVPPRSVHDLPDPQLLVPADFNRDGGVWLTANVWMGSVETRVHATMPDGRVLELQRTQQGEGEAARIGAEWADPFATMRQLTVARHAIISESGDEKAQGFEVFRGRQLGPTAPMPQSSISDRNMHLWRVQLPELQPGVYPIRVTSTDRNGQTYTDVITVEVRTERPPKHWRSELWR